MSPDESFSGSVAPGEHYLIGWDHYSVSEHIDVQWGPPEGNGREKRVPYAITRQGQIIYRGSLAMNNAGDYDIHKLMSSFDGMSGDIGASEIVRMVCGLMLKGEQPSSVPFLSKMTRQQVQDLFNRQ